LVLRNYNKAFDPLEEYDRAGIGSFVDPGASLLAIAVAGYSLSNESPSPAN